MGVIGREVLTRQILKTERVEVPEWEGEIILRELSAAQVGEMAKFGDAQQMQANPGSAMELAAWVLVSSWVDADGAPILTVDDVPMLLATQTADLINRLATRVMMLSGMAPRALASAEKNSESRQNDDSGIS